MILCSLCLKCFFFFVINFFHCIQRIKSRNTTFVFPITPVHKKPMPLNDFMMFRIFQEMLCSSYSQFGATSALSFLEDLPALSRGNCHSLNTDYEQIVPSQDDLTDTPYDWWNSQDSSFSESSTFCSDSIKMDLKKLPPSYDEHVSSAYITDQYTRTVSPSGSDVHPHTRTISPSGSDVSVMLSESDFSLADDMADQRSRLLTDIIECIQSVDNKERNEQKNPDFQAGTSSSAIRH